MVNKYKLSTTSALVLLWSEAQTYPSKPCAEYFARLDLTEGEELLHGCNSFWKDYDQVIKNRKYRIHKELYNFVNNATTLPQVVIFGAGMNPLCLEVQSHFSDIKIYEVEIHQDSINIKRELIHEISTHPQNISLVCEDVANKDGVYNALLSSGWDPNKQTIVIVEGISYYAEEKSLWKALSLFKSKDRSNRIMFEYLLNDECIAKDRLYIPNGVFGLITTVCHIDFVTRYDRQKILKHLKKLNGQVLSFSNMKQIELERTGKNKFFPLDDSGWIEVCLARL